MAARRGKHGGHKGPKSLSISAPPPPAPYEVHLTASAEEVYANLKTKSDAALARGDASNQHGIIAGRTTVPQNEAEALFREAQTITSELARQRGIVHEIREFQLPAGAPVITFVFKR